MKVMAKILKQCQNDKNAKKTELESTLNPNIKYDPNLIN